VLLAVALVAAFAALGATTAAPVAAHAYTATTKRPAMPIAAPTITWRQGESTQTAYVSRDEVALFLAPGAQVTGARRAALLRRLGAVAPPLPGSTAFVLFVRVQPGDMMAAARRASALLRGVPGVRSVSPVLFRSLQSPESRLALTGDVVVAYRGAASRLVAEEAAGSQLVRRDTVPGTSRAVIYRAPSALDALSVAGELARLPGVEYAVPDWYHARETRAVPDDPLFGQQWHLDNIGQSGGTVGVDAGVVEVWDSLRGSPNEIVAIVDEGVELSHEDLAANVVAGLSWDYVGNDANPSPGSGENHGTACAGVAAARGFNDLGVSGTAPEAGLVGLRLFDSHGNDTDADEAAALTRSQGSIDIRSSSWGPEDDRHLEAPGPQAAAALAEGAANGRGGRGTVFVWAGGNGADVADNANYDGYANSRFAIAVAACDNYGTRSRYSEPGANLLVAAPSSGGSLAVTTTDRSGAVGYSAGNYTSAFGGTSAAAPLVAGVTALLLQANPQLTWRDIQAILAETAVKNDDGDGDWQKNGAGYLVNHKYGFGLVNAGAAVAAARSWTTLGPELRAEASATPAVAIPDNNATGVSSQIKITDAIAVESVEIVLTAPHPYWTDLRVELVSPEGTTSVLAEPVESDFSDPNGFDHWQFTTKRCLEESARGTWTLRISDRVAGGIGSFTSWTLRVHGHPEGAWSDTTPPLTTAWGHKGWHSTGTTVTFSAFDPDSAVDRTEYRLDGSPWATGVSVRVDAPLDHSNDGLRLLEFRSYDVNGPVETIKSVNVGIDTLGPDARAPRRAAARRGGCVTLRYRVNDVTSPQTTVTIRIRTLGGRLSKTIIVGRCADNETHSVRFSCWLRRGTYRFFVTAIDLAGNRQIHVGSNRLTVR
jgi:kexin